MWRNCNHLGTWIFLLLLIFQNSLYLEFIPKKKNSTMQHTINQCLQFVLDHNNSIKQCYVWIHEPIPKSSFLFIFISWKASNTSLVTSSPFTISENLLFWKTFHIQQTLWNPTELTCISIYNIYSQVLVVLFLQTLSF